MGIKLEAMYFERRISFISRKPTTPTYKTFSERLDECFQRYYKNAPFSNPTADLIKFRDIFWQTSIPFSDRAARDLFFAPPRPKMAPRPRPIPAPPVAIQAPPALKERFQEEPRHFQSISADVSRSSGASASLLSVNTAIPFPEPVVETTAAPRPQRRSYNKVGALVAASVLGLVVLVGKFAWDHRSLDRKTALPYSHVVGPVIDSNKIYLADWFRSNLYVHEMVKGFPIVGVESIPNALVTGLAMTPENLWTIDGANQQILQHALTPEHLVLRTFFAPGKKPRGLFFDGKDLWSGDETAKVLYRHPGADVGVIAQKFSFADIALTSFQIQENAVWILDRNARSISRFQLKDPLVLEARFDLIPFLEGADPRGFLINGDQLILATENPSAATRIPLTDLKAAAQK